MRRSRFKLVVACWIALASGCANIDVESEDTWKKVGVENEPIEPEYAPRISTSYSEHSDFENASLLVQVDRKKTCRTQVYDVREKVRHEKRELTSGGKATVLTYAAGGGASLLCSALHFAQVGCFQTVEDDVTGEDRPLTPREDRTFGIVFGLGAVGLLTPPLVDLTRTIDRTEVVDEDKQPRTVAESECGVEPYPNANVEITPASPAAADSLRLSTDENGRAEVPVTKLGLHRIDTEPVAEVAVDEHTAEAPSLPSSLRASKEQYFRDRLIEKARRKGTAEAYLEYLMAFPDGEHASEAHGIVSLRLSESDDAELLETYLERFGSTEHLEGKRTQLRDRLHHLQVEKEFENYVEKFERTGKASPREVGIRSVDQKIRDKILDFHRNGIAEANASDNPDSIRTHLRAALDVVDDDATRDDLRETGARALLEVAAARWKEGRGTGAISVETIGSGTLEPSESEVDDIQSIYLWARELAPDPSLEKDIRTSHAEFLRRVVRLNVLRSYRAGSPDKARVEEISDQAANIQQEDDLSAIIKEAALQAAMDIASHIGEGKSEQAPADWIGIAYEARAYVTSDRLEKLWRRRLNEAAATYRRSQSVGTPSSWEQAVASYPPTVPRNDRDSLGSILANPNGNAGERFELSFRPKKKVGGNFLAEWESDQLIFVTRGHDDVELATGDYVKALVEVQGSIPYRRNGTEVTVPKLKVIYTR